jgi:hypothetical protein
MSTYIPNYNKPRLLPDKEGFPATLTFNIFRQGYTRSMAFMPPPN